MMLETKMLQQYSCKKNIWVSDNKKAMYDCWQLYRMVYGFLFSVSRHNFYKVGGFLELLVGWGCDDTSFISLCLEQNIKIIPVPSAHCLHISHPIRMKSQWEDGKKNERRMFKYIQSNKRINYMSQDFSSRVLCKYENDYNFTKVNNIVKKITFNNDLEKADYEYFLGNLEEAEKLYLKLVHYLDVTRLENLFDIMIRLNDKINFNRFKNVNQYQKCYFYYVADFYFNSNIHSVDEIVNLDSNYIIFLKKINKDDLKARACQYFCEKQWYLSFLDYYAISLYDREYLKNCLICIKKIRR